MQHQNVVENNSNILGILDERGGDSSNASNHIVKRNNEQSAGIIEEIKSEAQDQAA